LVLTLTPVPALLSVAPLIVILLAVILAVVILGLVVGGTPAVGTVRAGTTVRSAARTIPRAGPVPAAGTRVLAATRAARTRARLNRPRAAGRWPLRRTGWRLSGLGLPLRLECLRLGGLRRRGLLVAVLLISRLLVPAALVPGLLARVPRLLPGLRGSAPGLAGRGRRRSGLAGRADRGLLPPGLIALVALEERRDLGIPQPQVNDIRRHHARFAGPLKTLNMRLTLMGFERRTITVDLVDDALHWRFRHHVNDVNERIGLRGADAFGGFFG
jgi:hypothetical protein